MRKLHDKSNLGNVKDADVNLIGQPCGHHGPYTFYKAFEYRINSLDPKRVLMLGEFFFVRISPRDDPCIGELQLLWHDQQRNQLLSSTRLYFLPEQTPDGRLAHHGQHEVLAASEKVILKLADLVSWITHNVNWVTGIPYYWKSSNEQSSRNSLPTNSCLSPRAFIHNQNLVPPNSSFLTSQRYINDRLKIHLSSDSAPRSFSSSRIDFTDIIPQKLKSNECQNDLSSVVVLSFARYCRYRNLLKRVENKEKEFLSNSVVQDALIELGIPLQRNKVDILFCRDTFHHIALLNNDLNCEHLAPKLKGRPRKRLLKQKSIARASSPESISSEDNGLIAKSRRTRRTAPISSLVSLDVNHLRKKKEFAKSQNTISKSMAKIESSNKEKFESNNNSASGNETDSSSSSLDSNNNQTDTENKPNDLLKENCVKSESSFLNELYKFMKKRKTPIHRVPHLGFKKIDLHVFYVNALKFGGYEEITKKRLWKKMYDLMGGDKRSTSAATCTRRHYEKLLLPFERFLNGHKKSNDISDMKEQDVEGMDVDDGNSILSDDASTKSPQTNLVTDTVNKVFFEDERDEAKQDIEIEDLDDNANDNENIPPEEDERIILKLTDTSAKNVMKYKLSESLDRDMSIKIIQDNCKESKQSQFNEDVHVFSVNKEKQDERFTQIVKNQLINNDTEDVKINLIDVLKTNSKNEMPKTCTDLAKHECDNNNSVIITPTSLPSCPSFTSPTILSRSDNQSFPTILFSHSNSHKMTALVHPTQREPLIDNDLNDLEELKRQNQEIILFKPLKNETCETIIKSPPPPSSINTSVEKQADQEVIIPSPKPALNIENTETPIIPKSSELETVKESQTKSDSPPSSNSKSIISDSTDLTSRNISVIQKLDHKQADKSLRPLPAHTNSLKYSVSHIYSINTSNSEDSLKNCEILDLSVKKHPKVVDTTKTNNQHISRSSTNLLTPASNDGILLDLSVKKKKSSSIEQIARNVRPNPIISQHPKPLYRKEFKAKPASITQTQPVTVKREKAKPDRQRGNLSQNASSHIALSHMPSIAEYNPPLPAFIGSPAFLPTWNTSMSHFPNPHMASTSNTSFDLPVQSQQYMNLFRGSLHTNESNSRNSLSGINMMDQTKLMEAYTSPFLVKTLMEQKQFFNNANFRNPAFAHLFTSSK